MTQLINPFTAPISGLKVHGHLCKQSLYRLYITSIFDTMRFDKNPFTCQHWQKEQQKG